MRQRHQPVLRDIRVQQLEEVDRRRDIVIHHREVIAVRGEETRTIRLLVNATDRFPGLIDDRREPR